MLRAPGVAWLGGNAISAVTSALQLPRVLTHGPDASRTPTSSIKHSPIPRRKIERLSLTGEPRVALLGAPPRPPVNSKLVHWLLPVSSLSAQLSAWRLSLLGSMRSRLLPPPPPQEPPRPLSM